MTAELPPVKVYTYTYFQTKANSDEHFQRIITINKAKGNGKTLRDNTFFQTCGLDSYMHFTQEIDQLYQRIVV